MVQIDFVWAAGKKLNDGSQLNSVLEMIKEVKSFNLEACVTLGSIIFLKPKN